jgi:NADH:ubiquinone oxidoreductase subunit 6 (subunit J)
MNKKVVVGVAVATALLIVLGVGAFSTNWDTDYDNPQNIPFTPEEGQLDEGSLNYSVFETYGPVLLIVSLLMFGAIVGGVCIAREEEDTDDTD